MPSRFGVRDLLDHGFIPCPASRHRLLSGSSDQAGHMPDGDCLCPVNAPIRAPHYVSTIQWFSQPAVFSGGNKSQEYRSNTVPLVRRGRPTPERITPQSSHTHSPVLFSSFSSLARAGGDKIAMSSAMIP